MKMYQVDAFTKQLFRGNLKTMKSVGSLQQLKLISVGMQHLPVLLYYLKILPRKRPLISMYET